MDFKGWFTVTALVFSTAWASIDDVGPQTFQSSDSSKSQSPQYEMREVILYLTPSEIKALESGQGVLQPLPVTQSDFSNNNQEKYGLSQLSLDVDYGNEFREELKYQKDIQNENIANIFEKQRQNIQPPPVEEPDAETPLEPAPQILWSTGLQGDDKSYNRITQQPVPLEYPQSHSYFNLYNKKKSEHNFNIEIFHPLPHDIKELESKQLNIQTDPILNKNFKFIPNEYVRQINPEFTQVEDHTNEQFLYPLDDRSTGSETRLSSFPEHSDQSIPSLNSPNQKQTLQSLEEELLNWNYAPRYNDHKRAVESQKHISSWKRENTHNDAENEKLSFHTVANKEGKSPIKIVKLKYSYIKSAKVPQRHLKRGRQPIKVKMPHLHRIQHGIYRPIPIPLEIAGKAEKLVPYEVEKQIPQVKNGHVKANRVYRP